MHARLAVALRLTARLCSASLCFISLFLASLSSEAQPVPLVKFRATGFAPGSGPNARNAALRKAEIAAVETAVDELLGQDKWGVRPALVRLANQYRQSSRIVNVQRADGGVRVLAEVYIRNDLLRERAAAMLLPLLRTPPRVLFLIAEEVAGLSFLSAERPGFAELDLMNSFQSSGFSVIRAWRPSSRYSAQELLQKAVGSATEAARLGREKGADVVVVGQAKSWLPNNRQNPKLNFTERRAVPIDHPDYEPLRARPQVARKVSVSINLRVIRAADGQILDNPTVETRVQSSVPAEAARLALRAAARKIRSQAMIAASFSVFGGSGGAFVTLTINNAGDRRSVELIVEELRRLEASSVEIVSSRPEVAQIRFKYSGKMGPLVRGLEGMRDAPYQLEAREIVGRTMIFDAEFTSSPQ